MKMPTLIAREKECAALREALDSDRSELVIVCGRRRIGKTFLMDQFFKGTYDFTYTGGHNLPTRIQLRNFAKALKKATGQSVAPKFDNWFDAFDALEEFLESLPKDRKKVVFIDEMPWIDTLRSDFVSAFENFWNGWANRRYDIVFVATGSATSWMAENLIENQGGLHNRITSRIYLKPFTLKETEQYLKSRKIKWDRYQILQAYMLTGGVPYYLSLLKPGFSIAQNIDHLCFEENGPLRREFEELYNALFTNSEKYVKVVRHLYGHKEGLTKTELAGKTKINGTSLKKILNNLEQCNFITHRRQFMKKNDVIYRLSDFFTMFYLKFIEGSDTLNATWWTNHIKTSETLSWMGKAFELICMQHHQQVKEALSIAGMATEVYSWRFTPKKGDTRKGAQIDMVINRADHMINLCEIKFNRKKFALDKEYADRVRRRGWLFQEETGQEDTAVVHTFITTFGLSNSENWDIVDSEITLDDLFI